MAKAVGNSGSPVSRRGFFHSMAGIAATAAGLVAANSEAAEKASKVVAQYRGRPNGDQKCGNCVHYRFPVTCEVVAGPVISIGWCQFYKARG